MIQISLTKMLASRNTNGIVIIGAPKNTHGTLSIGIEETSLLTTAKT